MHPNLAEEATTRRTVPRRESENRDHCHQSSMLELFDDQMLPGNRMDGEDVLHDRQQAPVQVFVSSLRSMVLPEGDHSRHDGSLSESHLNSSADTIYDSEMDDSLRHLFEALDDMLHTRQAMYCVAEGSTLQNDMERLREMRKQLSPFPDANPKQNSLDSVICQKDLVTAELRTRLADERRRRQEYYDQKHKLFMLLQDSLPQARFLLKPCDDRRRHRHTPSSSHRLSSCSTLTMSFNEADFETFGESFVSFASLEPNRFGHEDMEPVTVLKPPGRTRSPMKEARNQLSSVLPPMPPPAIPFKDMQNDLAPKLPRRSDSVGICI